MDPRDNPYTPNAGATPSFVAGREGELANFDLLLARLSKGRTEQSMIITGLRGVGKTVLLGEFRRKAAHSEWVVVEIEASKHDNIFFSREIVSRLRTALFEVAPRKKWEAKAKNAASVLTSFGLTLDPSGSITASLGVDAAEGKADSNILANDLTDSIVAIGEAAAENETGIVILIDEVQFLSKEQLESLIAAIHKTVQRALPVTLIGAGLPQIAELAGDAKSYAERLFKFPKIDNLSREDAARALTSPAVEEGVEFTDGAVDYVDEVTGRYPYFIQEIGYSIWTTAEGSPVTVDDVKIAEKLYTAKLDESFFRVRLDRATPLQSSYLRAMAGLGPEPQKAADVAAAMGRTSENLGPTRAELINMGLLYTPEHGYAAFTVPHFDKFMLRAQPELEVPEKQSRAPRKKK